MPALLEMMVRSLTPLSRIASISADGDAAQAEPAGHDGHAVAQQARQRRRRIRENLVDRHARPQPEYRLQSAVWRVRTQAGWDD